MDPIDPSRPTARRRRPNAHDVQAATREGSEKSSGGVIDANGLRGTGVQRAAGATGSNAGAPSGP